MNCEDAFKKLHKYLDGETEKLMAKEIEGRKKCLQSICEKCPLNGPLKKTLKSAMFQQKASPSLRNRILNNL